MKKIENSITLQTIKISEIPNELENNKSIDSQNRGGPVEADIS